MEVLIDYKNKGTKYGKRASKIISYYDRHASRGMEDYNEFMEK